MWSFGRNTGDQIISCNVVFSIAIEEVHIKIRGLSCTSVPFVVSLCTPLLVLDLVSLPLLGWNPGILPFLDQTLGYSTLVAQLCLPSSLAGFGTCDAFLLESVTSGIERSDSLLNIKYCLFLHKE